MITKNEKDSINLYDIYVDQMRDLEEIAKKIVTMTKIANPYFYGKTLRNIYDIENEIMKIATKYYKKSHGVIFVKEGDE